MPSPLYPEFRPDRDPYTGLNRLADDVESLRSLVEAQPRPPLSLPFLARIVGSPTGSAYGWQRLCSSSGNTNSVDGLGMSGTPSSFQAYPLDGSTTVADGTQVLMWLADSQDELRFLQPGSGGVAALTHVSSTGGAIVSPSVDSTPTASGQTLALTAGTWLVLANFGGQALGDTANAGGYLEGWVKDDTIPADVPNSHRIFAQLAAVSSFTRGYGGYSFSGLYTVTGATTLEVYSQQISTSGSFSGANIASSGFVFEAIKIG